MSERGLGTPHAAPLAVTGDVLDECGEAAAAAGQPRVDAAPRLDETGPAREVERRPHRSRHRHSADVHYVGLLKLGGPGLHAAAADLVAALCDDLDRCEVRRGPYVDPVQPCRGGVTDDGTRWKDEANRPCAQCHRLGELGSDVDPVEQPAPTG